MNNILNIIKYVLIADFIGGILISIVDFFIISDQMTKLQNGELQPSDLNNTQDLPSLGDSELVEQALLLGLKIGIIVNVIIMLVISILLIITYMKCRKLHNIHSLPDTEIDRDVKEIRVVDSYKSFRKFQITFIVLSAIPTVNYLLASINGFNILIIYYAIMLSLYIYTFVKLKKEMEINYSL